MKINGIIAEYNPFHNGHAYHIETSKKRSNADYSIVVMSGNYVQRGTPAFLAKHLRAKMALTNGADLVLELPAVYSTASAEYFAAAGVSLLNALNCVDYISFGSEQGELSALQQIASCLANEPTDYKDALQTQLKLGFSYPAARQIALHSCLPNVSNVEALLSSPNNILAIEYLKALIKLHSSIEPITIKRESSQYNDTNMDGVSASALAIRTALLQGSSLEDIRDCLPENTLSELSDYLLKYKPFSSDRLSELLYYKLLMESQNGYTDYLDVTKDLSERILNHLNEYEGFDSFCQLLKTKEVTYSRISRCLLHIVLDIHKNDCLLRDNMPYVPYARILGFRSSSSDLLHEIKKNTSIPLISKLADAEKIIAPEYHAFLKKEIQMNQLYYGLLSIGNDACMINEYTIPPVIV